MKKRKSTGYIVLAIIGGILLISGIVLMVIYGDSGGIMWMLPFINIGVGCGFLGGGVGGLIGKNRITKNPALAKQIEIESKDERNIAISNKAKAVAFNFSLVLLSALVVFQAIMQVDRVILFVSIGVYFTIVTVFIVFLNKYHKEM